MTTPDVPAERERDEHVERVTNALEEAMAQHGLAFEPVDDAAEVGATLAALLAPQEAPTRDPFIDAEILFEHWITGHEDLAVDAMRRACHEDVVQFLEKLAARAAPQEAREPDGWVIEMRDGSFSQVFADRGKAEKQLQAARSMFRDDGIRLRPVYLGAPAPAEATERVHVVSRGHSVHICWCGSVHMPPVSVTVDVTERSES